MVKTTTWLATEEAVRLGEVQLVLGDGFVVSVDRDGAVLERVRQDLEHDPELADAGLAPADVGLAWLLSRPAVTAPIIGPRTTGQLDGTLRSLDIELSVETLARLDEIFPAPGPNGSKPAPEAYAW